MKEFLEVHLGHIFASLDETTGRSSRRRYGAACSIDPVRPHRAMCYRSRIEATVQDDDRVTKFGAERPPRRARVSYFRPYATLRTLGRQGLPASRRISSQRWTRRRDSTNCSFPDCCSVQIRLCICDTMTSAFKLARHYDRCIHACTSAPCFN